VMWPLALPLVPVEAVLPASSPLVKVLWGV
jgi:hypothetical protein